jgi:dTMP kinase
MNAPRFIVLEGIDGSGTTTQTAQLAENLRLRGHRVRTTFEPSAGRIGTQIRTLLAVRSDHVAPAVLALLFAADRLDHNRRVIQPALRAGEIVISDRYLMSSLAYQGLTQPVEWLQQINANARLPDLTVLLRVSPIVGLRRVAERRSGDGGNEEIFDVPETQKKLAQSYETLAARSDLGLIQVVDGAKKISDVASALLRACTQRGL